MRDPIRFLVPGTTNVTTGAPPLGPLSDEWLTKLAKIRGALFTVKGLIMNGGPRPGKPDNIASTDCLPNPDRDERLRILQMYKDRGYTHGPMGPFIDPEGYHHQNPAIDFRLDGGAHALSVVEDTWNAGIMPVCFISPDNWTIDQCEREFGAILRQPAWQRVCRIVVPGWEPSPDRSNDEWVAWFEWLWDVFPHSLKYIHMNADFDACGNNGDLTPGSPTYKGNDGCWRRVAPLIHGFLNQSAAFAKPDYVDLDPRNGGRTNFQTWADDCDPNHMGGLHSRFVHGYANWPTTSAWQKVGRPDPIHLVRAEYASYWCTKDNRPESEAQTWGDMALKRGAIGVLDGFHKG